MNAISIKNMSKRVGSTVILEDINLSIPEGQTVAIVGNSGAGKSTLLRCLVKLEVANSGDIDIEGTQLCVNGVYLKGSALRKALINIGMVFQSFNLFPNLSVADNLMLPLKLACSTLSKATISERASALLDRVGLLDKRDRYPSTLSGGEKQRAAIARALMMRPKIMLFDEPTSALDPQLTKEVLQVIQSLTRDNITMLIVTHEIEFAKQAADRMIYMNGGRIIEDGTPSSLINAPTNALTAAFFER